MLFVNLGLSEGTIAFNRPLVQLSFFFVTWSAFHWGEFAVTAGWNRARANVGCKCRGFLRASMKLTKHHDSLLIGEWE